MEPTSRPPETLRGTLYACLAFGAWGVVALYWKALGTLDPVHIVAYRVVFSAAFVAVVLGVRGELSEVWRTLIDRSKMIWLLASGVLIAFNWGVFIGAVFEKRLLEASLGYFLNPLLNVGLGVLLLREKLGLRERWAVVLAILSIGVMAVSLPWSGLWVPLGLATSFALYGLLRKRAPVSPLIGLFIESLLVLPLAITALVLGDGPGLLSEGPGFAALVALSGPLTALPLAWFAIAARSLPLSRLAYFQYLSPTLQFLTAIFLFGEPLLPRTLLAFALVWCAIAVALFPRRTAPPRVASPRAP